MATTNALNLKETGIITADGSGNFTGSTVTEGGVLLGDASNGITDTGVLAKGTILVGDGAGAPTELAVGSNDQVLTADSAEASGVKWADAGGGDITAQFDAPSDFDDFLYTDMPATTAAGGVGKIGWGVSAVTENDSSFLEAGHPGILRIGRGTSGSSIVCAAGTRIQFVLGAGSYDYYWMVKLSALSDGTDGFRVRVGLGGDYASVVATGDPDDGVFFAYEDSLNSGNWTGTTRASSTSTEVDSSVAADTDWVLLRANINAAASTVTFYIDGSNVGTSSTNIPSAGLIPFCQFEKTSGSSNRYVYADYHAYQQTLTTSRA